MSGSLFSPHWFRVAALHPQLRPQVSVGRQVSRGREWFVLHNQANGRFHRVSAQAYEVVGRLDGSLSLEELWRTLIDLHGDAAPAQDEVLRILGQLTEADLLQAESVPDIRRLAALGARREQAERRARMNPLAFRVGLFDPTVALQRADRMARLLFNRWAALAWLALLVVGGATALDNLNGILAHAQESLLQPRTLLLMWLSYPLLKAVHEAGHALALQRWQCDTHEVGVSFLLLMPVPYVDATSSLRLPSRWQRATIAGAGIAVELAAAAAASLVWVLVQPGLVRDLALVVMTLGGVSTLLFNGNPLMRYDGYYLLCDLADLPNLAGRSAASWRERLQRAAVRLLGAAALPAVAHSGDLPERLALWLYAPASWCWRLVVGVLVVNILAGLSPLLALAGGAWMLWSLLVMPLLRWVELVASTPQLDRVRLRAQILAGGSVAAVVLAVGWVPLPVSLHAEGLVWLPEEAQLRAGSPARVVQVLVADGHAVRRGQPLIRLDAPELLADRAVHQARIAAAEAERSAAWGVEPVRVRQAEEALRRDRGALADTERRIEGLTLRAPVDGIFVLPAAADGLLRDVDQGEVLAHVLPQGVAHVRALVTERDVALWREALRPGSERPGALQVMLADTAGQVQSARLLRQAPAALERLPVPALGSLAGGSIPTDPQDAEGLKPLLPVFAFELELPGLPTQRIGSRARVRLELPPQALAERLAFRTRQMLLRHFAQLP